MYITSSHSVPKNVRPDHLQRSGTDTLEDEGRTRKRRVQLTNKRPNPGKILLAQPVENQTGTGLRLTVPSHQLGGRTKVQIRIANGERQ